MYGHQKETGADCTLRFHYITDTFEEGPQHKHDAHQIMCFIGSDPKNINDFDADIEIALGEEGEVHTFTKSTAVFVPRALLHGPFVFKKITTPVIIVTTGGSRNYTQRLPEDWEKTLGSKSTMRRLNYGGKEK